MYCSFITSSRSVWAHHVNAVWELSHDNEWLKLSSSRTSTGATNACFSSGIETASGFLNPGVFECKWSNVELLSWLAPLLCVALKSAAPVKRQKAWERNIATRSGAEVMEKCTHTVPDITDNKPHFRYYSRSLYTAGLLAVKKLTSRPSHLQLVWEPLHGKALRKVRIGGGAESFRSQYLLT